MTAVRHRDRSEMSISIGDSVVEVLIHLTLKII